MRIKSEDDVLVMTETITCHNYGDAKHLFPAFEQINEYDYKCNVCGGILRITRTPIVVLDSAGRLKVQVVVEPKL